MPKKKRKGYPKGGFVDFYLFARFAGVGVLCSAFLKGMLHFPGLSAGRQKSGTTTKKLGGKKNKNNGALVEGFLKHKKKTTKKKKTGKNGF